MSEALLDVNVLIALLDANHQHHAIASEWVDRGNRTALCAVTVNGCARILGRADYPDGPGSVSAAIERIESLALALNAAFWSESLSLLDRKIFRRSKILRPAHITDLYLVALAVKRSGALATFDRGIPLAAVSGATDAHVLILA
jgi:hypothetical protein